MQFINGFGLMLKAGPAAGELSRGIEFGILALVGHCLKALQPVLGRGDAAHRIKGGVANGDVRRSHLSLLTQLCSAIRSPTASALQLIEWKWAMSRFRRSNCGSTAGRLGAN